MPQRPDASMSLLTDLQEGALEPEYRTAGRRRDRSRFTLPLMLVVLGALLTYAAVQTIGGTDQNAVARDELVQRIEDERARQEQLLAYVDEMTMENRRLAEAALTDPALREQISEVELVAAGAGVTGPGVVFTLDDAAGGDSTSGQVMDSDLSILVNGLYEAGAEAIAINGRRLSTLTAIRAAGSAITVDYVSLSPPYRVEAIGDPLSLQARFARTSAASWWQYLTKSYGLSMTIEQPEDDLTLTADPGITLRYATTVGEN
ncbi:DUF881 domain-containing protein [Tessaracoccus caeni]|uniref:DUF881 domain-containing protein n=1 Tax=Tessaracoccus caeni TaxID=3031239 RepID=UPI0023DBE88A|nr:DUF881 domain-containing protein [Tessaracoccus caeni]MDF1488481.1 DUF881 domain-containing protein [Tessaracoccus caeni]